METKFKVLMNCGNYVDANLIQKGIYFSTKPFIYSQDETIETLTEKAKYVQDFTGKSYISDKYFENIKQCELVDIELNIGSPEAKMTIDSSVTSEDYDSYLNG